MSITRKLNADEWFLAHQLKNIKKGFHLPFYIDADITNLEKKYSSQKISHTAVLIKATSILLRQKPEINKVTFQTLWGTRVFYPGYNGVNLPVLHNIHGKSVVSGFTIYDADKKSLQEIKEEIKKAKARTLKDLPINRIIHGDGPEALKKLKLWMIYFFFKNFPSLYEKKCGGGISVSSLLNLSSPDFQIHISSYGMTTLTISSCTVYEKDSKKFMKVGVAFDHLTTHGHVGTESIFKLADILQSAENL